MRQYFTNLFLSEEQQKGIQKCKINSASRSIFKQLFRGVLESGWSRRQGRVKCYALPLSVQSKWEHNKVEGFPGLLHPPAFANAILYDFFHQCLKFHLKIFCHY